MSNTRKLHPTIATFLLSIIFLLLLTAKQHVVSQVQAQNVGVGDTTPTFTPTPTGIGSTAPTNTPTPIPTYTVSGTLFVDSNNNGVQDNGEVGYQGATVSINTVPTDWATTDTNGAYSFINVPSGNYSVNYSVPVGYQATTTRPVSVTLGPDATVNFGIMPIPTNTPVPTAVPTPTNTPIPTPTPDTVAPAVSITSPANNSSVRKNSFVTITATASDNIAVSNVDFYVNNSLVCSDTTSAYSCAWTVPSKPNVNYTLKAKAFDTSSNFSETSITVTSH